MTDEEKKAIQYLNKYCDTDLLYEQRHYNYIKMIIRLVRKQSKEIEELKEKNEYLPNWVSKKYVSKDKIKAKIDYIKNRYNIEEDYVQYKTVVIMLQSLLEKE